MKRIAILLTLLSGIAFGQVATRFDGVAQTTRSINGNTLLVPSPNASVTVCTYPATGGLPCTNKASVCPDSTGVGCTTGSPNNPITADAQGNFGFWGLPGTYQYTVCPTGGVCRGPYNASLPNTGTGAFSGTFTGNVTGDVTGQSGSTLRDATQDKAFINVLSGDCPGVVGGGFPQDDGAALNTCFAAHKGFHFRMPMVYTTRCTSGHGGGCVGVKDYYSSVPLLIQGNGVILEGEGNCKWTNGCTTIQFAAGIGGVVAFDAYGGAVRSLGLLGQNCWSATDLTTFDPPITLNGSGPDGIIITSGLFEVTNSSISCFGRSGINVNGDGSYPGQDANNQPDQTYIVGNVITSNRGFGIEYHGIDSQAGTEWGNSTYTNQLAGVRDNSQTGNGHGNNTSQGDNRQAIVAGANGTIATIQRTSNVTTYTGTAVAGAAVNKWVTCAGTTNYNRAMRVASLTTTSNFTMTDTGGNLAQEVAGTCNLSSSVEVFAAYLSVYSVKTGCLVSSDYSNQSTWFNPYCETTSGKPNLGNGSLVTGANRFETNIVAADVPTWSGLYGSPGNNFLQVSGAGGVFSSRGNNTAVWSYKCGGSTDQTCQLKLSDRLSAAQFCFQWSTGNTVSLFSQCSAAKAQIVFDSTGRIDYTPESGQVNRFVRAIQIGLSGSSISDSRELVQNAHSCGTTTTCANTANGSNRIIFGTVALSSGTPSTAVVSSITAFTSTSSYVCTLTNMTNAANNLLKVVNTSTSSFTITGPNTITDTIAYQCIGN